MAMRTRQAFLHELRSHLGEMEHPPGSDETIFNRFIGVGRGPWCMDFVATCLWAVGNRDLAGLQHPHGTSYVPFAYEWAVQHGRLMKSLEEAEPGDSVVFGWPGPHFNPHGNHIGVLLAKSPFVTIEGNTHRHPNETDRNDRVIIRYDRPVSLVVGFIRWTLDGTADPHHGGDDDRERHTTPPWPGRIFTLRTPLMHGADVRMWQQQLASRGRTIEIDGFYGPQSEEVCRRFQEAHGLVVDGQVGPTTWRATWVHDQPHPPVHPQHHEQRHETNGHVDVHHAPLSTGVDRAGAPSLGEALAIRNHTGASWWGVYIGGPCSAGYGWTPSVVHHLGSAGFHFLPIYVGQNAVPHSRARTFTRSQGVHDGRHAVQLMHTYGWQRGRDIPVCLDVESITYEDDPHGTLEYVRGWVSTVRDAGYVPVVYSSPTCLRALHTLPPHERPSGAWVASWLGRGRVDHSLHPHGVPHFPDDAWQHARVWQYEGDIHVPGASSRVDVSCSLLPLAPPPHR